MKQIVDSTTNQTGNSVEHGDWSSTLERLRHVNRIRLRTLAGVAIGAKQLEIPFAHLIFIKGDASCRT